MWEGVELWKKFENIAILYTVFMQKTQEQNTMRNYTIKQYIAI